MTFLIVFNDPPDYTTETVMDQDDIKYELIYDTFGVRIVGTKEAVRSGYVVRYVTTRVIPWHRITEISFVEAN